MAAAATTTHAVAESGGGAPFRLAYQTHAEGCPDAPAFLTAIRARTERVRIASTGEPASTIAVSITQDHAAVNGRVTIREPDGAEQTREIASTSCPDVSRALALIVALWLDPDATSEPRAEPPAPSLPRRRSPPVAPPAAPPEAPAPVTIGVGASLGISGGVGPSVAPRGSVFGDLELAYGGPAWARASVRLSVDVAGTHAEVGPGSQDYLLVAGALRLCPLHLPLGERLHLAPCGGIQAGVHHGTSQDVPNERSRSNPWVAPSATGVLAWEPSRRISLQIDAGLGVPLVRTRFFLAPDLTLFRTPALMGTAALSVLVRFR